MMKDRKGFTLVEILAVIIIVGIIMLIAIPAVTNYISDSRKSAFLSSINKYIDIAIDDVTSLEYSVSNPEYTYYIPKKTTIILIIMILKIIFLN